MGDLVTNVPISELIATCEVLDRVGINRFGLKRVRSDLDLAKQLTWIMHQSPTTDFRIEVPKTPLIELTYSLGMYRSGRRLVQIMSVAEKPLTMPNRHLALLDFGLDASVHETAAALKNLARQPTKPGSKPVSYLEASLRDLLLLEQQHREEIENYDIYLTYVPIDDFHIASFRLHTGPQGERLLESLPGMENAENVRFLARKS